MTISWKERNRYAKKDLTSWLGEKEMEEDETTTE
jgi:hypothetical protein